MLSTIVETSEATEASSVTARAAAIRLAAGAEYLKPARTKASALAWPMPDEAPVTRAVFKRFSSPATRVDQASRKALVFIRKAP